MSKDSPLPRSLSEFRDHVDQILSNLKIQAENQKSYYSWIDGKEEVMVNTTHHPTSSRAHFFNQFGFLHIPSFAHNQKQVIPMKEQIKQLVHDKWELDEHDRTKTPLPVFRTDDKQIDAIQQQENDYFLNSADAVHFFAEKDPVDDHGRLKPEFQKDKMKALNKVGHGLHRIPGPFHEYSTSNTIRDLVFELGWKDPVIPQSMYIFKQARVGSTVTSHQDSTFLYTLPRQSCLGLWLALDDATVSNGCLWVRPGSHREPLRRRFVRNPHYFNHSFIQTHKDDSSSLCPLPPPLIFIHEPSSPSSSSSSTEEINNVTWEGTLPPGSLSPPAFQGLLDSGFIPVECKAGDLVVFPGTLDHLSLSNTSDESRHTFQLHLVEGPAQGIHWSEGNWLQYPPGIPFQSIK